VAQMCTAKGATVLHTAIDVTDADTLEHWLNDFDTHHPIDLVIANAGVSGGPGVMSGEHPTQIKKIFDVNIYGTINTIHPVIERMLVRQKGHVAIVSSVAGFRGFPTAPAYSTSKAAVRYYGQALRGLLEPFGITISVVCPGFIRTRLTAVNTFPMPFILDAPRAATIVKRSLDRRKSMIIFPWIMGVLARLQNLMPDRVMNAIYRKVPAKPIQ
jgi:short-subunit dehydrogenase